MKVKELKQRYQGLKKIITARLLEFKEKFKKGSEEQILAEMLFCILTPQSKAKGCWSCMVNIVNDKVLVAGTEQQILARLIYPRFKYKKAKYFVEARDKFKDKTGKIKIKEHMQAFTNVYEMRDWFWKNIKGYGLKEASHFLRNVGFGEDIAILDRHILKNLKLMGVIKVVPKSISAKIYHEIELKMKTFAKKVKIPMGALDLVLWAKEAGEVFK